MQRLVFRKLWQRTVEPNLFIQASSVLPAHIAGLDDRRGEHSVGVASERNDWMLSIPSG